MVIIEIFSCNACMTTYNDGAYLSIRISKEIISSKEMLDVLVSKYMHEELELMYQNVRSSFTLFFYYYF